MFWGLQLRNILVKKNLRKLSDDSIENLVFSKHKASTEKHRHLESPVGARDMRRWKPPPDPGGPAPWAPPAFTHRRVEAGGDGSG